MQLLLHLVYEVKHMLRLSKTLFAFLFMHPIQQRQIIFSRTNIFTPDLCVHNTQNYFLIMYFTIILEINNQMWIRIE